jgi:hypothetical protein
MKYLHINNKYQMERRENNRAYWICAVMGGGSRSDNNGRRRWWSGQHKGEHRELRGGEWCHRVGCKEDNDLLGCLVLGFWLCVFLVIGLLSLAIKLLWRGIRLICYRICLNTLILEIFFYCAILDTTPTWFYYINIICSYCFIDTCGTHIHFSNFRSR